MHTVYSFTKKFRRDLQKYPKQDPFFLIPKKGRPFNENMDQITNLIVSLRKKNLSVPWPGEFNIILFN